MKDGAITTKTNHKVNVCVQVGNVLVSICQEPRFVEIFGVLQSLVAKKW